MLSLKTLLYRNLLRHEHIHLCQRLLHTEALHNRSILKVSGQNVGDFIQGMITNDIHHLNENANSIYTMFLNVQGRVLFDGIIYKNDSENYTIDCDSQIVKSLVNHMKLHKVRRKIYFEQLDEVFKVWVIFDQAFDWKKVESVDMENYLNPKHKETTYVKDTQSFPKEAILTRDPRLKTLGDRILLPVQYSLKDLHDADHIEDGYETLRFKLGVGEGVNDLERGKCLPLEANCDYLHGVSFHKGCYVGQELTARTYHTGVVRKRLMPLVFEKDDTLIEKNSILCNEKGKNVGKVINVTKGFGIGLLRVQEALEAQSLTIGGLPVKTFKPGWWPIEISKEKIPVP